MIKKHLLGIALFGSMLIGAIAANAQTTGMAVNTSGAAAAASAMLDVSSTNKGILVPRIASTASVTSPATGLLIYNTTTNQFNYYNGTAWTVIGAPTGSAGGDLSGTYPNPTISSAGSTGDNIVTAINASAGGLNGTKLATTSVSVNALSATGTRNSTTYLRGDNTWATVSSGTTLSNGSAAGQIYTTGTSPFAVQATPVTVSGDATLSSAGALTLATVNSNVGTFGSTTTSPQITVDAKGRITAVSNQTIAGGGGGTTYLFASSLGLQAGATTYYSGLLTGYQAGINLPNLESNIVNTPMTIDSIIIFATVRITGGPQTCTFTVYKNLTATSMIVTVPCGSSSVVGATIGTFKDVSHAFTVAYGDRLSLRSDQTDIGSGTIPFVSIMVKAH